MNWKYAPRCVSASFKFVGAPSRHQLYRKHARLKVLAAVISMDSIWREAV